MFIINFIRALLTVLTVKTVKTEPTVVRETVKTEPTVVRETVAVAPIALGTDTVRTETRTAKRFHKGTNVSVWGRNQQFDGDFIGGYVITDDFTGAKAVILTDRKMANFEIDMVGLDVNAIVLLGDEAFVGSHQQGQNMDDVVSHLSFDRAESRGNFALWVINQLSYGGYTLRQTSVHGVKNIRAGELRSR
jgi:hypothetical protein